MLHQLAVVRIIRAFLRCNLHRLFVETPFKNLRSLHRAQGAAIRRRTNKSIRILHFNRIFHQRAKRGSSISRASCTVASISQGESADAPHHE